MTIDDLMRWEDEGGAVLDDIVTALEQQLDSIGQYVETEGVDWVNGAATALRGTINYINNKRAGTV